MTFGLPLFLIAALAGIIPVLFHLISRRKAVNLPFSTIRFLRISVQRTRRRKRLHDLWLLLVRVSVLVLIAIALARPAMSRLNGFLSRGNAAVVVVLDNSLSMGTQVQGRTRFDAATQAVEQLLNRLRDGDEIAFLPTNGPLSPASEQLSHRQETVWHALAACRLSGERADFASRLRRAHELLESAESPNKEIYVGSDMQAIGWKGLQPTTEAENAPTRPIPVGLIDVHLADVPNVAIRSVDLRGVVPVAGLPLQVNVEVFNASSIAQQKHIELSLDGVRQAISPELLLEPGGTSRHTLTVEMSRAGIYVGDVSLSSADGLAADDRRTFGLAVDSRIRVAIVKPDRHEIESLDDSFYLEQALGLDPGDGWAIQVTTLTPDALSREPLAEYAALFCVNLSATQLVTAARLHDYVVAGGHLVWISGNNVDPTEYNSLQAQLNEELLPAWLDSVCLPPPDRPDGWNINWLDLEHPALKGFSESAALYQSVLVYKHVKFRDVDQSSGKVLAQLNDGEPLLVERGVGAGSVMMLGTGAHLDWTNLPIRPIFLPLLAQLTYHFAGAGSEASQLIAGTPWTLSLPGELNSVELELTRPDGQVVRTTSEGDSVQSVRINDTHDLGVYRLRSVTAAQPREWIQTVNTDPLEADPLRMSEADLQARFAQQPVEYYSDANDLDSAIRRQREGHSLWELFLTLVLVGLVLETLIANRLSSAPESSPHGMATATFRSQSQSKPISNPDFEWLSSRN
jgi:hypothetical protein